MKLIDKDDFLNRLIEDGYFNQYQIDLLRKMMDALPVIEDKYREIEKRLKGQYSIDIVRCKECKYSYTMITARSKDGQERWTRFCDKHKNWYPKDDWFCKDGERKES